MRALSAWEILDVWERAGAAHPVDRALALLGAAMPETPRDEAAALPLGARDALLLRLRQATFGEALQGSAECPDCSARVEFELRCGDLIAGAGAAGGAGLAEVGVDGYSVRARPACSLDVAAIASDPHVETARQALLARCTVQATREGQPVAVSDLPDRVREAVAAAMLDADPYAEILLDLRCPACHRRWQGLLDIGCLFWAEVASRAQRLLFEVHLLARAYGWREADILGMSAARRAAYLQMVTA